MRVNIKKNERKNALIFLIAFSLHKNKYLFLNIEKFSNFTTKISIFLYIHFCFIRKSQSFFIKKGHLQYLLEFQNFTYLILIHDQIFLFMLSILYMANFKADNIGY